MPPTLLIVDDHDGFRSFGRMMLNAEGFEVIGEAVDGEGVFGGYAPAGD